MRLYIKQKVFSWVDKFTVRDERGQNRWFAEGELFTYGKKLHILDVYGREQAFIRRKLFSFMNRYYIEIGNQSYEVVKEFTLFKRRFRVEGTDLSVEGDFYGHNYKVLSNHGIAMKVFREWMTWGDSYVLDIANPAYELLMLCLLLVIDCMNADASNSSHSHH